MMHGPTWRAGGRARTSRSCSYVSRARPGSPAPARRQSRDTCDRIDGSGPIRSYGLTLAYWIGLALALALEHGAPAPPAILRADFGVSAAVLVITLLGNLFRLFGGGVSKAVKRALEGMRSIIVDIGRELATFARDTAGVFGSVWSFFRKFWSRVLFPMLQRLDRFASRVFTWLRETFGPIIEFLQNVRRELLKFYDKWFRPILDTIDAIRGVLRVFSFFGLEWARRLDSALAEIQDRITHVFDELTFRINEIIGWVDRIVTLDGLFQRLTLLRSLLRYERDMWNTWWESIRQREAEKGPVRPGTVVTREPQASAREVAAFARDADDPDRARINESVLDVILAIRGARPLPR